MKLGLVDIIIVNLNGKHYLEQCLPSIEKETKEIPYQLVVVDNGSEDGSIQWIQENYPSAVLIQNKKNVGFSKACNQGIFHTQGEYILLLNNDTIFLNDVISVLTMFIKKKEDAGIVGPLVYNTNGTIQASMYNFPRVWRFIAQQIGMSFFLETMVPFLKGKKDTYVHTWFPYRSFPSSFYQKINQVEWISGCCLMFRRSLFEKIGPLDQLMPFGIEDMDYARRSINAGLKNYFVPEGKIIHIKSGSRNRREYKKFARSSGLQGLLIYFRKYHSGLVLTIVVVSLLIGKIPRFFKSVIFKR